MRFCAGRFSRLLHWSRKDQSWFSKLPWEAALCSSWCSRLPVLTGTVKWCGMESSGVIETKTPPCTENSQVPGWDCLSRAEEVVVVNARAKGSASGGKWL